jgi:tol-pal system protein YbgF
MRENMKATHTRALAGVVGAMAALLCLAEPGQAANKDLERLYIQVAALQSQIADLQRNADETLKEVRRLNEALAGQGANLQKSLDEQRAQNEALQSGIRDLNERLGVLGERLETIRKAAMFPAGSTGGGVTPPATGPGATGATAPSPPPPAASAPPARELYSQAYADYARGNFDLAIQEYQEYLRNYATTEFADNAQYWIGECLYSKQKYPEAIEAWNELFRAYPSSDKLPDARFKKGMALEKLGRRREALAEYRQVVDRYPNSEAGRKARERLNP